MKKGKVETKDTEKQTLDTTNHVMAKIFNENAYADNLSVGETVFTDCILEKVHH